MRHRWPAALLDLLAPPSCVACDETCWSVGALPLCAACLRRLPPPEARCRACGRTVGPGAERQACPRCVGDLAEADPLRWSGGTAARRRRALRGVIACWAYAGSARALVTAAKFRGRPQALHAVAAPLAEAIEDQDTPGDLLVPVPLSSRRRQARGFNQAGVLARALAPRLDLDITRRALRRHRHARPQSGRSRTERLRAVRGAFVARPAAVRGRCVLLVDDVLTTGATAVACARALRAVGAIAVTAAVACRAERR